MIAGRPNPAAAINPAKEVAFGNIDRLLFIGLYRFSPKALEAKWSILRDVPGAGHMLSLPRGELGHRLVRI